MASSASFANWPNYSQNNDPMPDGLPNNNPANNCGPESCAEVTKHLTGVELPAEFIKDQMHGASFTGYTSIPDITAWLARQEIPTEVHAGDASTKLQPIVEAALDAHHPLIVLFFWDRVALSGGHFMPVIGYTSVNVAISNPWTGMQEVLSWEEFERIQNNGNAVVCKRTRYDFVPPASTLPTPLPTVAPAPAPHYAVGSVGTGHTTIPTNLRAEPDDHAEIVRGLAAGVSVMAIGPVTPHWAQVALSDGTWGWLKRSGPATFSVGQMPLS